MKWFVVLSSFGFLSGTVARSITVYNHCPFTIWSLYTGDKNTVPNYQTGWTAAPLTSVTFDVPENWNAGRIWARRNCDFSSDSGPNSCVDGGCVGGLQCTLPGVLPATLAEFTLSTSDGNDYYDVSLVDGYNLPVSITNTAGCHIANCPVDLDPNCPGPLRGPNDSNGSSVGCKSACGANLDGNPTNSANCCTGSHSTPATCPSSGVAYYSYFKGNCPNSYAFAYDESSGSALWTCPSSKAAGYTITFCP
ncbi:hypothetical protein M378DRAFT_71776 [Amanita muscaria Koide BX008]|uniref:Thaumatin-like protein n=1 Tax=Amanita muscaria (strain Koide BX008) TaxID=946122 RepID=A0A0C2XG20_AMAMK|nr:hypothetical protein M378DRAFT_71776 [Amanita muscaria Koide BX008]